MTGLTPAWPGHRELIMLVLAGTRANVAVNMLLMLTFVAPAVIGLIMWLVMRSGKGPRKEIAELADQMGLGYEPVADDAFRDAWSVLPEIQKAGRARHVVAGPAYGIELTAFEHVRFTMAGNQPQIITHSVYSMPAAGWPDLQVTPRIGRSRRQFKKGKREGLLIGEDGFDEQREVKAKDAAFARWLLAPEMRKLMLEEKGAKWYVVGEQLCLVYPQPLSAERIRKSVDRLRRFWSAVPTVSGEPELAESHTVLSPVGQG